MMMEFSVEELAGFALEAELNQQISKIKACRREAEKVAKWLEQHLDRLHPIAVDYIVETALSLANEVEAIADTARKLRAKGK